MIREKALKKIFISTLSLFIILSSYVLLNFKDNVKPVISNINISTNSYTYLIDNYGRLVRYNILLTSSELSNNIKDMFSFLKSDMIPNGLKSPIRDNLNLDKVIINSSINIYLSDSPNITELQSISYSIFGMCDNLKINYYVDNKLFTTITKDFGINKRSFISDRNNISSATVFYNEKVNDRNYFVPVTKYVNSSNKIDIIIESLTSSYITENNLMSTIMNEKVNNYKFDDNILFIDFNNFVNKNSLDGLSLSIFDNYDIDNIVYTSKNKIIDKVKR